MKLNYIKTLFVAILVIFATTANAETYSGTCGDNVNWSLNTETGLLKITGTGAMENYTGTSMPWYSYRTSIKSVEISEGVTSIGDRAFYGCAWLTSVTIPNSVTSIGNEAFYGCSSLTSITIPNSVTSIGFRAFEGCSSLTGVYITDLKAWCNIQIYAHDYRDSPLYYAKNLYLNNELVTDLVIPEGVETIKNYVFFGCTGLTSVTIPNSVTSIGSSAFSGCTGLTDIYITDLKAWCNIGFASYDSNPLYANKLYLNNELVTDLVIPEGVETIKKYAFFGCTGLTSVTIPNSVTSIGRMAFSDCTGLTSVTIGNSVTSIGDMAFYDCSGLTSITIPNSVTSIGNRAFDACTKLSDLRFEDGEKTLSLGYNYYYSGGTGQGLFYECPLETLYLGRNLSYNTSSSYGYSPFYNKTTLISVTIGNSVTSIGSYAFYGCSSLTGVYITDLKAWCNIEFGNIYATPLYYAKRLYLNNKLVTDLVIPEGVETIKDYAFDYCTGLTSITIPNSVTSITGFDFNNYKGLSRIDVASDNANYSSIDGVVFDKDKTQIFIFPKGKKGEFVIPNSVTSIGDDAFYGCTGLTSISIPNSVTSIGNRAFDACTKLSDLRFEDGEKTLSLGYDYYSSGGTGQGLFYDCPLKTLYLGRNLSYNASQRYGYSPFYNKTSLISVTIGDSVTSIQNIAFLGCSGLTSITIPNSVTSIGNSAFSGCSGLTSVTIGNSVTSIGGYTFRGCTGLTSISIPNSVTSIQNNTFMGCTGLTGVYITDLAAWCNIEFGNIYANPLYYSEKLYLNNKLVTNLVIPQDVTEIKDYTFYNCSGLTSISIPNGVTSIGDSTFYCNISAILTLCATPPTLGTNTFSSYSIPVHLFGDASDVNVYKSTSGWSKFNNYVTHTLPLDFTAINEEKTITYRLTSKEEAYNQRVSVIKGEEAYRGNINIPDTVLFEGINFSVTSIGDAAFSESNIIEIGLPQTLEKIGDEAFYGCSRLRNMTYPESLKSIGVSAFEDCVKMTEVVLCENVEKIEAYAFAGCTGLTNVYSLNPVPPVCDVDAFYGIGVEVQPMTLNKAVTNVSLYVPEGSVSAYQVAPEWCNFYNIVASDFVGIEDFEIDTNSDKPNAYISGGMLMLTGIEMLTNVAVYNLSGTNVANVMVTPDNCSIDLSNLPKGIYIVAIKGNAHKVIL